MLGLQSRRLLIGAAANQQTIATIRDTISRIPEIEDVVRLLTMQLGSQSVLVTGELQLANGMSLCEAEEVIARLDRELQLSVPAVTDTFWEPRRSRLN